MKNKQNMENTENTILGVLRVFHVVQVLSVIGVQYVLRNLGVLRDMIFSKVSYVYLCVLFACLQK